MPKSFSNYCYQLILKFLSPQAGAIIISLFIVVYPEDLEFSHSSFFFFFLDER